MHANAQPLNNVPYINASGGAATADNVIPLTPADFTAGTEKTLTAGWYIVNENITHDRTITINGTVHLILKDEKFLTVTGSANSAGINVANPHSLTIYAQSTGANMGILTATGGSGPNSGAGIGSNVAPQPGQTAGTIIINGGKINATGGSFGAGIGGGSYGAAGNITINGGTIIANGTSDAAGIGTGVYGVVGGTITITGGTVTATGGGDAAGIGGGRDSRVDAITISGGTVVANGGNSSGISFGGGAGIGSGGGFQNEPVKNSGNITISGNANVTATGGNSVDQGGGAGIGTGGTGGHPVFGQGWQGTLGTIIISTSGTVIASGGTGHNGRNGAAIGLGGMGINEGGGAGAEHNHSGTTTMYKITVTQTANGVISPVNAQVSSGGSVDFTVTANAGYAISSVSVSPGTDPAVPLNATTFNFSVPNVASDIIVTATFALPVIPVAPSITSQNKTSVLFGNSGSFQVQASGDAPINFSISGQPTGVSIDAASGLITIANTVAVGKHTFTLTAANGVSPNATQNFTLTIRERSVRINIIVNGGTLIIGKP